MAKIAYVGLPAHGHTNPTLPVMKELVERGHEVLYYNAEYFRPKVAPTGVSFRPLPEPLPTEKEVSEALHELINASQIISRMAPHLTRFLISEFEREKPDLVIYDSAAMWGYIAARTHHIPNICFVTTFVLEGSIGTIGFSTMLRFIWSIIPQTPNLLLWRRSMAQEFGKENSGGITEFADLNIVFTSKAFHPENSFVDGRFRFVGPSLNQATRDGDFPFAELKDGRKVYISLGTITNLDYAFYQAVFRAFADHPAQFILSVGKNTDIGQLGQIPDNFIVRNYVPQLEILQRVDAFITHGGMNSVHEGLYYGVPEIVVPHQIEQLLNGKRVAQTTTGILLGDKRPYGRVTAQELRQSLDELLHNPQYHQNADRIGRTLKDAGGYLRAVEEIETYVKNPLEYAPNGRHS
ncbi:MAG: macrolide family glycosyltransferase [Candidatus Promineifilaceae bacterium]